jgi:hypothetical protein
MRKIILTTIFTCSFGLFYTFAQVDEADPKDNTRYEMEMDSINQRRVTEAPEELDSTSSRMADTTVIENTDTTNLRNINGNDESIRQRSIKNNERNSEGIRNKKKKIKR